jgi:hypothetical protein
MERVAINDYFRGVDANTLVLNDLNRLREKTKISKLRDKHNNMKMSLFAETIGVRYRGHIQFNYLDCALFRNLGNCLYITHIIIRAEGISSSLRWKRFFTRTTT